MNTAIIYRSMTGHSKKIAQAVAEGLNLTAYDVKTKPQLDKIDLLFIVGGVYSGKSLPEMTEYVKTLTAEKIGKAVLITSSATDKNGQDEVREILIASGIKVEADEYRCRGNFLFVKMGHPSKSEIDNALLFAKRFM